jgi:hypothetical protein
MEVIDIVGLEIDCGHRRLGKGGDAGPSQSAECPLISAQKADP